MTGWPLNSGGLYHRFHCTMLNLYNFYSHTASLESPRTWNALWNWATKASKHTKGFTVRSSPEYKTLPTTYSVSYLRRIGKPTTSERVLVRLSRHARSKLKRFATFAHVTRPHPPWIFNEINYFVCTCTKIILWPEWELQDVLKTERQIWEVEKQLAILQCKLYICLQTFDNDKVFGNWNIFRAVSKF